MLSLPRLLRHCVSPFGFVQPVVHDENVLVCGWTKPPITSAPLTVGVMPLCENDGVSPRSIAVNGHVHQDVGRPR